MLGFIIIPEDTKMIKITKKQTKKTPTIFVFREHPFQLWRQNINEMNDILLEDRKLENIKTGKMEKGGLGS